MTTAAHINRQRTSAMMSLLHGDYVAYYPRIADITGSIKAAVLLSQALSWTSGFLRQNPWREGWFWKTRDEWRRETGLSRWEQESARLKLRTLGVLEEKRMGAPSKLFFRINMNALGRMLGAHFNIPFETWNWEDTPAVRHLLGSPVIIYRKLALALDGVLPALYLSKVILTHRHALLSQPDIQWLSLPVLGTSNRLGLGRYEALGARKLLNKLGLIDEQTERRVSPRKMTRLNPEAVYQIVLEANKNVSLHKTAILDCTKPPFWNAGFPPPGKLQNLPLESCKASACSAGIPPAEKWKTSIPETGLNTSTGAVSSPAPRARDINNTDLFTQLLPTAPGTLPAHDTRSAIVGRGSSDFSRRKTSSAPEIGPDNVKLPDLIFPHDLQGEELQTAIRFLSFLRKPELRQPVLDEWMGQIKHKNATGKPLANRLGYLNGIVRSARMGEFYPTLGLQVAADRVSRTQVKVEPAQLPASREVIDRSLGQIRDLLGLSVSAGGVS